jgi:hypothetical protein
LDILPLLEYSPTLSRKVARVVVLKPPAVEPGEPPTSIRRIRSIWELPAKRVRSTVLKPRCAE